MTDQENYYAFDLFVQENETNSKTALKFLKENPTGGIMVNIVFIDPYLESINYNNRQPSDNRQHSNKSQSDNPSQSDKQSIKLCQEFFDRVSSLKMNTGIPALFNRESGKIDLGSQVLDIVRSADFFVPSLCVKLVQNVANLQKLVESVLEKQEDNSKSTSYNDDNYERHRDYNEDKSKRYSDERTRDYNGDRDKRHYDKYKSSRSKDYDIHRDQPYKSNTNKSNTYKSNTYKSNSRREKPESHRHHFRRSSDQEEYHEDSDDAYFTSEFVSPKETGFGYVSPKETGFGFTTLGESALSGIVWDDLQNPAYKPEIEYDTYKEPDNSTHKEIETRHKQVEHKQSTRPEIEIPPKEVNREKYQIDTKSKPTSNVYENDSAIRKFYDTEEEFLKDEMEAKRIAEQKLRNKSKSVTNSRVSGYESFNKSTNQKLEARNESNREGRNESNREGRNESKGEAKPDSVRGIRTEPNVTRVKNTESEFTSRSNSRAAAVPDLISLFKPLDIGQTSRDISQTSRDINRVL